MSGIVPPNSDSFKIHYVSQKVYNRLKKEDRFREVYKKGVKVLEDKKEILWDVVVPPKFK